MKKIIRNIILAVVTVVVVVVLAFTGLYYTRIQTISSIEQVTDYEDGYNLYTMNIAYDYSLDDIIGYGIVDDQTMIDAILKEALPFLPVHIKAPSFGCTAFTVQDAEHVHMGRNYDFKNDTSSMLVYCSPKDGYRSMAFAALDNVSANTPDANIRQQLASLTAPFICLDGMNEKGVSIAVLTLDSDPTYQDTGKPMIATTLAIRLVLDRAATTQEAVDLLRRYDMFASSGRDYHFYIIDAQGDGRVIEYDPEQEDRPLVDTPSEAVTNFHIPAPQGDPEAPTQVLISTIDYNEYVGRIGVGKVSNGSIKVGQEVVLVNHHDETKQIKCKVNTLYEFEGLQKVPVNEAGMGSIVAISGISDLHIGDTLCAPDRLEAIPFPKIEEPTISMTFSVNDSPLAGRDGKYVTSRHIKDRLERELQTDVSLRVEETDSTDTFKVSGRGELHLSVLIETMRREGYEFAVSKAEVIYHTDENGKRTEPIEECVIDVPEEFSGAVIQELGMRKGELINMGASRGDFVRLEFHIPSRGLIGYRNQFLTDTKGNGIMNNVFLGYEPYKGDIAYRKTGSLISFETGTAVAYGLFGAQDRGTLFIKTGDDVYQGMIIGQAGKAEDVEINVCKTKHLTNTRTSASDEALRLVPPRIMSLEQAIEYVDTDELLEVTPKNLRLRKKILDPRLRKRAGFKQNQ